MADETAKGAEVLPPATFFNAARISHTNTEFYFDFAQLATDAPQVATVVARLVTTPVQAKSLVEALSTNLKTYEARFGTVEIPEEQPRGTTQ